VLVHKPLGYSALWGGNKSSFAQPDRPGRTGLTGYINKTVELKSSQEGDETLSQVAQRGDGCPIPGNIQGQVGQGSEQPGLVEDVPAYCSGVRLDDR